VSVEAGIEGERTIGVGAHERRVIDPAGFGS
jgi:hypothetical protein